MKKFVCALLLVLTFAGMAFAKELIAVALSIQNRCETCIMSHVKNALKAGVTREEFVDMLGVCVLMGGGPNSAYAATALEVYDQFSAKE